MTRSTGATGYYSCSDGLHPTSGRKGSGVPKDNTQHGYSCSDRCLVGAVVEPIHNTQHDCSWFSGLQDKSSRIGSSGAIDKTQHDAGRSRATGRGP